MIIQIFFILYLNFKKKIFLGDSGSLLLSFLLGSLIIKSYNNNLNVFLADEIFLIMLLPGLELLRLAIFRILKKKHPFVADNEHIHHYLLNRYNFVKTTIIIQSIYIFPIIFYYSFNNIFYSISILIIYYGFVIYKNSSN